MVRALGDLIDEFPGLLNMVRCFAHTVNLGARSVMKQFDAPDSKTDKVLSEAEQALRDLMEGLDMSSLPDDDDGDDDDLEWIEPPESDAEMASERTGMSVSEQEELEESLMPTRMVLAKVRLSLHCVTSFEHTDIPV